MGQNYNSPPTEVFAARGGTAINADSGNQTVSGRAIYVGGTGQITVVTVNGDTLTFFGLVPTTVLDIAFTRVNQTGTTAAATLLAIALR
jgi:hypothetical protein